MKRDASNSVRHCFGRPCVCFSAAADAAVLCGDLQFLTAQFRWALEVLAAVCRWKTHVGTAWA